MTRRLQIARAQAASMQVADATARGNHKHVVDRSHYQRYDDIPASGPTSRMACAASLSVVPQSPSPTLESNSSSSAAASINAQRRPYTAPAAPLAPTAAPAGRWPRSPKRWRWRNTWEPAAVALGACRCAPSPSGSASRGPAQRLVGRVWHMGMPSILFRSRHVASSAPPSCLPTCCTTALAEP